jgi:hypothetical protein
MSINPKGIDIPELFVKSNEWLQVTDGILADATDGQIASQRTEVAIRAESDGLSVKFSCYDNPYTEYNTYQEHNTDMWNQEVFELFIAAGEDVPKRYLELEINPNNALFTAWVDNPDGVSLNLTMIPHDESGVSHQVIKSKNEWSGSFFVPFSLIGKSDVYRLNFYRIALYNQPDTGNWAGDTTNSSYLCWNSTLSGAVPAFHRPARFGKLRLI